MKNKLKNEILKFKKWSEKLEYIPENERNGEWELLYEDWDIIDDLFYEFIATTTYKNWDLEDIELILYIIARDNECEKLINEIVKKQPNALVLLANKSFESNEPNAKWQIATRLDKIEDKLVAQSLLKKFLEDENEYVRRRALMKIAEIGDTEIEKFCEKAWNREDKEQEYQRMAVLYSLKLVNSPQLEDYLQLAIKDGRKYLVEYAKKL